jgi:hypothetical protein
LFSPLTAFEDVYPTLYGGLMFIERAALMRILEAEAADVPNDVNDTEPGMRTYVASGSARVMSSK